MCITNQAAIIARFRAINRNVGNLPPKAPLDDLWCNRWAAMNDQLFLAQKLERAVTFHIDGVSEIAIICGKHGNNDAVFMVVGCFIDSIANRKLRHRELLLESSMRLSH
jgi:hypothetical protein